MEEAAIKIIRAARDQTNIFIHLGVIFFVEDIIEKAMQTMIERNNNKIDIADILLLSVVANTKKRSVSIIHSSQGISGIIKNTTFITKTTTRAK